MKINYSPEHRDKFEISHHKKVKTIPYIGLFTIGVIFTLIKTFEEEPNGIAATCMILLVLILIFCSIYYSDVSSYNPIPKPSLRHNEIDGKYYIVTSKQQTQLLINNQEPGMLTDLEINYIKKELHRIWYKAMWNINKPHLKTL